MTERWCKFIFYKIF